MLRMAHGASFTATMEPPAKRVKFGGFAQGELVLSLVGDWVLQNAVHDFDHVCLLRALLFVSRETRRRLRGRVLALRDKVVGRYSFAANYDVSMLLKWFFYCDVGALGGFSLYVTPEYGPCAVPCPKSILDRGHGESVGPKVSGEAFAMGSLGGDWFFAGKEANHQKFFLYSDWTRPIGNANIYFVFDLERIVNRQELFEKISNNIAEKLPGSAREGLTKWVWKMNRGIHKEWACAISQWIQAGIQVELQADYYRPKFANHLYGKDREEFLNAMADNRVPALQTYANIFRGEPTRFACIQKTARNIACLYEPPPQNAETCPAIHMQKLEAVENISFKQILWMVDMILEEWSAMTNFARAVRGLILYSGSVPTEQHMRSFISQRERQQIQDAFVVAQNVLYTLRNKAPVAVSPFTILSCYLYDSLAKTILKKSPIHNLCRPLDYIKTQAFVKPGYTHRNFYVSE